MCFGGRDLRKQDGILRCHSARDLINPGNCPRHHQSSRICLLIASSDTSLVSVRPVEDLGEA